MNLITKVMHIAFSRLCLCNTNSSITQIEKLQSDESNIMQQRDQTVVQVITPSDIKSDQKSVQSEKDEGRKVSVNNGGQCESSDKEELEKETFFKKFGGMLMALGASFFFSVSFLIVKILGNHGFKAFGCSVLFNLGVLIPCFIGILLHEKGPKSHERSRLFKEIWPLRISDKATILKILFVSLPLTRDCNKLDYTIIHFLLASRNTTRTIGCVTQFQSSVHDHR